MPRGKPITSVKSSRSQRNSQTSKPKSTAKAQRASAKPKPPKIEPKDQAVESLKKLSKVVERLLVQLGEIKLPEQQEAPNKPEMHESVAAVRGQTPRI
jgi:hypothetical protein